MSVLSSMWTGITGLQAQGEALGVVADNIANANTTGFKASRAEFSDVMSRSLKGIDGGNQLGRGTRIQSVTPLMSQGGLDNTDRSTDLAINGNGFFQVKGSEGTSYTRDGSFRFDKNGLLVTSSGQRVQGFQANEKGKLENKVGDIKFPKALINASATKELKLDLNLDSRNIADSKTFDPKDPYTTSHYATATEIFDSQGNKHILNLFFTKGQDRTWTYRGLVDGKEVTGAPEDQELAQVVEGKLTFTEDGKLQSQEVTNAAFNFKGGAQQDQKIKINFGDDIASGGKGIEGTKQFGKESDVISWTQDGFAAGTVTGLSFNDEGVLTASYSNGQVMDLAQIGLAKFENPEALFKIGGNLFKESRDSGAAAVGAPRMAGRGSVMSKSLERSTVDLASEFVNMITNQRSFQANAKTITTSDELLSEVIQLKR
ncbi:MAG: flagellar hook protein FlgE [Pseudobdellovibrio sp.]